MASAVLVILSTAWWESSDTSAALAKQAHEIDSLKQTVHLLKQTVEAQSMALKLLAANRADTGGSAMPDTRASAGRALSSAANIARLELSPFEGKSSRLHADATGQLTITAEDSVRLDTPAIIVRNAANVTGRLTVSEAIDCGSVRSTGSISSASATVAGSLAAGSTTLASLEVGDLAVKGTARVEGDVQFSGKITKPSSTSPSLGAYPSNVGVVHTNTMYGQPPPSPPQKIQFLNVRENGHWGGFGALLTVFDDYFTPGRRQYWYSSRGQGSLSEVSGSALGSCDCTVTHSSNGKVYDPDGTTNDLYEDGVYLNIPNYHYCSVRIEWSARSTTFQPDPNAVQSDTARSVKLLNGPAVW